MVWAPGELRAYAERAAAKCVTRAKDLGMDGVQMSPRVNLRDFFEDEALWDRLNATWVDDLGSTSARTVETLVGDDADVVIREWMPQRAREGPPEALGWRSTMAASTVSGLVVALGRTQRM